MGFSCFGLFKRRKRTDHVDEPVQAAPPSHDTTPQPVDPASAQASFDSGHKYGPTHDYYTIILVRMSYMDPFESIDTYMTLHQRWLDKQSPEDISDIHWCTGTHYNAFVRGEFVPNLKNRVEIKSVGPAAKCHCRPQVEAA